MNVVDIHSNKVSEMREMPALQMRESLDMSDGIAVDAGHSFHRNRGFVIFLNGNT